MQIALKVCDFTDLDSEDDEQDKADGGTANRGPDAETKVDENLRLAVEGEIRINELVASKGGHANVLPVLAVDLSRKHGAFLLPQMAGDLRR